MGDHQLLVQPFLVGFDRCNTCRSSSVISVLSIARTDVHYDRLSSDVGLVAGPQFFFLLGRLPAMGGVIFSGAPTRNGWREKAILAFIVLIHQHTSCVVVDDANYGWLG